MKPKIIIQEVYNDDCIHLLIRVNNKRMLKNIINYFSEIISNKKNLKDLEENLRSILQFKITTFFSARIRDRSSVVDYLIIDEGKGGEVFIYFNIITKKFKKINNIKLMIYFKP